MSLNEKQHKLSDFQPGAFGSNSHFTQLTWMIILVTVIKYVLLIVIIVITSGGIGGVRGGFVY